MSDSYFLVSHFHYTMMGGSVFGIFAAIYFWWPKAFGYRLSERLGRGVFGLMFVGFNLTFWPQFVVGLRGMPRRIVDYAPGLGWETPNLVSSLGVVVLASGVLLFLVDAVTSWRRRTPAGDDPWGGTLEWATASPPPEHNFTALPRIRSERPVFDMHHPELQGEDVASGHRGEGGAALPLGLRGLRARARHALLAPDHRVGRGRDALVPGADAGDRGAVVDPSRRVASDPRGRRRRGRSGLEAGESLGSFPTGTAWPLFLVLGVFVTGAGLVYGLILAPVGAVLIVWAVAGLTRESRG